MPLHEHDWGGMKLEECKRLFAELVRLNEVYELTEGVHAGRYKLVEDGE